MLSEVIALTVYYPFELIKVRLLTKNDVYKYDSISDAAIKILRKDKVSGLYWGVTPFFFTFMGQYTLQMTLYELFIDNIINIKGNEKYKENEKFYII